MVARTDHGHPAVRAQARGVVIAVGQAGLGGRRHHPRRRHVPDLHLFLHPVLDGIARHHAAQHALGRWRDLRPAAFCQLADVVQKLCAVGQQQRARTGSVVQRPFKTRVAHIDGQESHAANYPEFCGSQRMARAPSGSPPSAERGGEDRAVAKPCSPCVPRRKSDGCVQRQA